MNSQGEPKTGHSAFSGISRKPLKDIFMIFEHIKDSV